MRKPIGRKGAIDGVADRRKAFTMIRCVGNKVAPAFSLHPAGNPLAAGEWPSTEIMPKLLPAARWA
jgi:hypothetical protein